MSETTTTTTTTTGSPVTGEAPAVNIKDKNIFGTVEVKIKEVKGCQTHFLFAKCELAQKKTEIKSKALSNHTFVDVFEFRVSSPNSEVEIEAWKKNLFFKDKITGRIVLPISELLGATGGEAKWYPLTTSKKTRRPRTATSPDPSAPAGTPDENAQEKDTTSEGEPNEDSPKQRTRSASVSAKKPKDPPEICLEIKFTKNEPPKEVLKGIILDGQWTTENSVGSLTSNPHWIKCVQYLLTVKNENTPLTLKLRQPEGTDQRVSFFVINYDPFYGGSKKVILDTVNDIKKVDNFICPIAATAVDCQIELEVGQYCIVPYAETFGFAGSYKLNVDSPQIANIELYPLPKDESCQWKEVTIEGLWTSQINGGGDINVLHWTKNPQYAIHLTKKARACVLLSQDDNEKSIGFYVLKQTADIGKRLVEFRDQVGKTEAFKPSCHNGCTMTLEKGDYIVIPSTYDQALEGAYHITMYTDDQEATFTTITHTWKETELIKGTWVGKSAGGSPNNGASFFNNPQFRLKLPKDRTEEVSFVVQLIQDSTLNDEGIGFIVITRESHEKPVQASTFQNEDLFTKTNNWEKRNDIACRVTIKPDQPNELTVIPSTFEKGVNRSFRIQLFSEVPIEIEEIEASEDSSSESEELT
ncbi:calpain-like cysteine protease [Heterostelium album PN500]|uniref:Calpain-like cysteine protease n=1 Tax=Heterostelium pallidum (strain ATCC 26659 / Pp 5 / PN500) TaxID=670386 RepID=D3BN24_HETP5|nr:calpain-like cysteine protease [Heterostelium album PN500]EFA77386.1 calpain-like cysteine protease [Heterostelium album PN500]|eukprot:XP_020429515.1 calpain-like cysteine protease [Heterostelium album PN500]